MRDLTVRQREIDAIVASVSFYTQAFGATTPLRLLDLGCGNGFLLEHLRKNFAQLTLLGMDYSPDMVALAVARKITNCEIQQGDIRELKYDAESIDIAVSERCIINLLDEEDQAHAFSEVARVMRPSGLFVCIEAFTDGLENLNRAKVELGLMPQNAPYHNRWLGKDEFRRAIDKLFEVISCEERESNQLPLENFLSSHYFVSRVLYPAVTKSEIQYNTAFVQFFEFLEPRGNFSPIQLQLLRRTS
jgi:ubiquinone/menaquinone biosynthesis C-methylase UbiE